MQNYPYALVAFTNNISLGNEIASALDPDDGSGTFGGQLNPACRIAGSTGPATMWPAEALIKPGAYEVVTEFISGGYPAALLAIGFTTERLDQIRSAMTIVAGPRAEIESTLAARVSAAGYEFI